MKYFSVERIRIYENSCQMLDTTIDWQLRSFLLYDTVNVVNRSFSFNDIRAFATAMEANLESLTLSSVGLTARSINVLCEGLKKCVHLHSLVIYRDILNIIFNNFLFCRIYLVIN